MKYRLNFNALACYVLALAIQAVCFADDELPVVPDGFVVDTVATEPLVRNPCVMAFDRLGRICVAQGPQWRGPTPETPGDRVDILIDVDGDAIADRVKTFAEGFNCIQGIAWYGNDLWIANAPDLTVVRDTDGDDVADVYLRVYTGLGNLEHSLHGLNFGPDGKLYMSKGNSKGYNRLDQLAPRAFRELWGLASPKGAPDYTEVEVFTKETYQRAYHTPQDDWGQQGGILRCDPYTIGKGSVMSTNSQPESIRHELGRDLEVFSRGFRNPWDICFDDGFDWLGTDNDQTEGDKVFAPFYGSHFGWGHPWSFHWKGLDHLPTVPISMPLYEGSGTGVVFYNSPHFPQEYQNVFFVNDWMRREVYLFRPEWEGAFRRHVGGGFPSVFAHVDGGRSLPTGSGRVFEPTDIEVGPDGALYILSWGHGYGATMKDGKQVDAGRVYRIRHSERHLIAWHARDRRRPLQQCSIDELFDDLGSSIPGWRVNAQNELLRRGDAAVAPLRNRLAGQLTKAKQTWALWTLGRISPDALLEFASQHRDRENVHLQTLRILAQEEPSQLDSWLAWDVANARLRHASVQAVWQSQRVDLVDELIELSASERDRIVFYSTWNALGALLSASSLKALTQDSRPRVRLAALLALFLDDAIEASEVLPFRTDWDSEVADLVELWLEKTGNRSPLVELTPAPGEFNEPIKVTAKSPLPGSVLTYTNDGSTPAMTGQRVPGTIAIDRDTTLRIAVFQQNTQVGAVTKAEYRIRPSPTYRHREFIDDLAIDSGRHYEINWIGLAEGKRHYTDRDYRITDVPSQLAGMPFLRTANGDDRRLTERLLSFRSDSDVSVLVGVDARNQEPLAWMKLGERDGFQDTGLRLETDDPDFKIYKKSFPAGEIALGANINHAKDSRRGNYIVIFKREILTRGDNEKSVTVTDAVAEMDQADPERGRELFLHPQGAGCFKCHQMQGIGQVLGPDLFDIGNRVKKPEVLIESIIHPSKIITEGFAQQKILTVDGRVIAGSVLEETGRAIKLALSDGSVASLAKDNIEERVGTKVSPMPDGFGKMMTAQQIADLTAWLMTQQVTGDRDGFWFEDVGDSLHIHFAQQRIATYLKRHPQLARRALVNVTTPSGIPITRNFPPRKPDDLDPGYGAEDGIIHPIMHPGIWIGFGDVHGNDYWRLQSKVVFDRFTDTSRGDRETGSFAAVNRLVGQDEKRGVCEEITRYRFERVPEGLLLRLDAEYRSDDHDFYFGDQEESGLAVRVASPIRVQGGNGTIVNDRREKNGAQVWGKEAEWFDFFGTIGQRQIGIMVVPSPNNPRPSWLHARDYGVVVTNPFPKQPRERRDPYVKTWVKRGESLRLSYAILIHDLPAETPINHDNTAERLQQLFQE